MKYYSTQRPITPGNYPKSPFKEVLNIVNFDSRMYCEEIGQEAWGYIEYKAPLHPKDAMEYELMPVPDKIIHVSFVRVDSWGHRVYKDGMGRIVIREKCRKKGMTGYFGLPVMIQTASRTIRFAGIWTIE